MSGTGVSLESAIFVNCSLLPSGLPYESVDLVDDGLLPPYRYRGIVLCYRHQFHRVTLLSG